jgi:hypothetical protein
VNSGDDYSLEDVTPGMFGVTRIPPEYRHALDEFDGVFHDD